MESPDLKGVEDFLGQDQKLKKLYEEHKQLKKRIAKLEKKSFLTKKEEEEERRLKKLKLAGKDQIIRLLARYRRG